MDEISLLVQRHFVAFTSRRPTIGAVHQHLFYSLTKLRDTAVRSPTEAHVEAYLEESRQIQALKEYAEMKAQQHEDSPKRNSLALAMDLDSEIQVSLMFREVGLIRGGDGT